MKRKNNQSKDLGKGGPQTHFHHMDVVIVDHQVPDKQRTIFQKPMVKASKFWCKMFDAKKEMLRQPAKVFHPAPTLSDQVRFVSSH